MKALLDTNIIIHREANNVINQDIGTLFRWLDRSGYQKCIHPVTIEEIKKNPNKATVQSFWKRKITIQHFRKIRIQQNRKQEYSS